MKKHIRGIDVQAERRPDGTPSPKLQAFLEEALAEMNKNVVDHRQPPWKAFPDYNRHSMGWRMGPGEDYWCAFHVWMKKHSKSALEAFVLENPEPEGWEGFYESIALRS